MGRLGSWVACWAVAFVFVPSWAGAAGPRVVSVEKIWDRGAHNAFTDLIRWRDRWYCTFREGEGHVGGDGRIRVLESRDGEVWEPVALIAEEGIDLRDPKLSITPDDRLMIVAGGSVYEGNALVGRQPRVTFSDDGRAWSAPARVCDEGDWLWRVTWHDGTAYGISYDASERNTPAAREADRSGRAEPGPADWKLKLFGSRDGLHYELITHLDVPGHPNESTIRFLPDGEMIAMVRREGGDRVGWIGRSRPPYRDWRWTETAHRFGGPNFLRLPDGSLWAAGRSYGPEGARTVLARMTPEDYEPVLTLPSGGDTSYPGLAWHDGMLWVSYYSSHEGKSAIYLAKIALPAAEGVEDLGTRLEPMVDDALLERLEGSARLAVMRPEPREVVLVADAPWEGNTSAYYTVFRDGGRFRMYYRGSHFDERAGKAAHREVTCYAESDDGIRWTKPELGLFEFDGSRANNIVWDGPGSHNFTPFLDANPACPPEARYKALASGAGGLVAFRSADGVRWEPIRDEPVITRGAFDSQNLAFWDASAGRYREYHRGFRDGVRGIMGGTSEDFLHWTDPEFLRYRGASEEHLYTNAILPHPGAPHVLIGFPTRFLPETEQTEPTFMVSRDGETFLRYPEAVIPTSAPADRDGNRSNYMAWGVLSLPGDDRELSVYAKEAYYAGPGSRLRRFTYRRSGFAALTADAGGGEAVTRPLRFEGGRLRVNARSGEGGGLRVEVQDSDGSPVPGLSLDECRVFRGDDLDAEVTWTGGDLAALAGRPVRLRFALDDAALYSIRFE